MNSTIWISRSLKRTHECLNQSVNFSKLQMRIKSSTKRFSKFRLAYWVEMIECFPKFTVFRISSKFLNNVYICWRHSRSSVLNDWNPKSTDFHIPKFQWSSLSIFDFLTQILNPKSSDLWNCKFFLNCFFKRDVLSLRFILSKRSK